jgi:hypothetical protein
MTPGGGLGVADSIRDRAWGLRSIKEIGPLADKSLEIGRMADPSSSRTEKRTWILRRSEPDGKSWLTIQTSQGLGSLLSRNRRKLRNSRRLQGR